MRLPCRRCAGQVHAIKHAGVAITTVSGAKLRCLHTPPSMYVRYRTYDGEPMTVLWLKPATQRTDRPFVWASAPGRLYSVTSGRSLGAKSPRRSALAGASGDPGINEEPRQAWVLAGFRYRPQTVCGLGTGGDGACCPQIIHAILQGICHFCPPPLPT